MLATIALGAAQVGYCRLPFTLWVFHCVLLYFSCNFFVISTVSMGSGKWSHSWTSSCNIYCDSRRCISCQLHFRKTGKRQNISCVILPKLSFLIFWWDSLSPQSGWILGWRYVSCFLSCHILRGFLSKKKRRKKI